jgi:hypothetical protein
MIADILSQVGNNPADLMAPDFQRTPDHPVFLLHILRPTAYLQWTALRERLPAVGYWPVLGWDFFPQPSISYDLPAPDVLIEVGSSINIDSWLAEQELVPSLFTGCRPSESALGTPPFDYEVVRTNRSEAEKIWGIKPGGVNVPPSLTPVDRPWKVPAYLLAITVEIPVEVQIGMRKRWFERWSAELVSAVPPGMDLRILRPPTTMTEVCGAAAEMIGFCWELEYAETGEEQVAELAPRVLKSTVWTFHW